MRIVLAVLLLAISGCGSIIRGVIRDKPTGNPIGSASVAVQDKSTMTNAYGVYVLQGVEIRPSTVLMINAPGYFLYSASVNRSRNDGDEVVRDVELVPKSEIAPR
jgi:uncharacterized protein YceK